jgi:hypothetical protein
MQLWLVKLAISVSWFLTRLDTVLLLPFPLKLVAFLLDLEQGLLTFLLIKLILSLFTHRMFFLNRELFLQVLFDQFVDL